MTYAYLRISTNESKQKHSFTYQLSEIKKHFHIGKVFQETISGGIELSKRKALLSLMEEVKKGDKVIVIRLDRLSRDTIQSGWIRYEFEKKGVDLITLENTKKDNTTKLIDNILLAFAEYEKETIKWRIKKAFEIKKEKGQALGGKIAKFGYDFYYEDGIKKIRENPKEQKVILKVLRFRNKTPSAIARILGREGVKGKDGKTPICRKQVQRIIERKGK